MKLPPWKLLPASLALASLLLSPSWLGADPAPVTDTETHDITITVSEIAELAIVGAEVSFTVGATAPTAGAAPAIVATNASAKYLQYTSVVAADGNTRSITVSRDSDLPAGLTLRLQVTLPGANKKGTTGNNGDFSSAADLTALTGTATQNAVTAIGSGWTGTAATDGANLAYSLVITADSEEDLVPLLDPVTVTYTLTGDA